MRALFLHGRLDVRLEERPAPTIARPDEVILAVAYTGICGSELHAIEGYELARRDYNAAPTPSRLGHEYAGVVTAVGDEVESFQVGQRVTVAPRGPCHRCDLCHRGMTALCRKTTQRGGSWADFIADGGGGGQDCARTAQPDAGRAGPGPRAGHRSLACGMAGFAHRTR